MTLDLTGKKVVVTNGRRPLAELLLKQWRVKEPT